MGVKVYLSAGYFDFSKSSLLGVGCKPSNVHLGGVKRADRSLSAMAEGECNLLVIFRA